MSFPVGRVTRVMNVSVLKTMYILFHLSTIS